MLLPLRETAYAWMDHRVLASGRMKETKRRRIISGISYGRELENFGGLHSGVGQAFRRAEQQHLLLVPCGSGFIAFALAILLHFLF